MLEARPQAVPLFFYCIELNPSIGAIMGIGDDTMNASDGPTPEKSAKSAAANVADAHQLLKALQEQLGKHPELEQAIAKLELALSALTLQTGGLL
jgi:hypothetical protein